MARLAKKRVPKRAGARNSMDVLQKALAKQTKAELIEALKQLAREDRKIMRQLESRFDIQAPDDDLMDATRQAIGDATDFDEREINYNFDYDYEAYETVRKNLQRLVKAGRFEQAMELSLELMKQGSYQIEMSDEGMMTEEVEDCLKVVIKKLPQSGLPENAIVDWCDTMIRADRVGFVCDEELKSLRQRLAK